MPTLSLYQLANDLWILWDVGQRLQVARADNPEYLETYAHYELPDHMVFRQKVFGRDQL